MITIKIVKTEDGYQSFSCNGHAGYADEGEDIICAAVSVLTVNTINAIEQYTSDDFEGQSGDGNVEWRFTSQPVSHDTKLLMDTMLLGLKEIRKSYGKNYIKIMEKRS